jgi:hypothetical protein
MQPITLSLLDAICVAKRHVSNISYFGLYVEEGSKIPYASRTAMFEKTSAQAKATAWLH